MAYLQSEFDSRLVHCGVCAFGGCGSRSLNNGPADWGSTLGPVAIDRTTSDTEGTVSGYTTSFAKRRAGINRFVGSTPAPSAE